MHCLFAHILFAPQHACRVFGLRLLRENNTSWSRMCIIYSPYIVFIHVRRSCNYLRFVYRSNLKGYGLIKPTPCGLWMNTIPVRCLTASCYFNCIHLHSRLAETVGGRQGDSNYSKSLVIIRSLYRNTQATNRRPATLMKSRRG